ncbi:hypothetical protein O3G_MSEX011303 [Manduca sexta]|uniref:LRRCT domain-containing protein n=1 Tax=Manduca sexta TaxID=7130 RepID=A0A921ZKR5_MANSE|nr:hypothetical protein O3G_MSEX011303 [Manduca sexta]
MWVVCWVAAAVVCAAGWPSAQWRCPALSARPAADCACDLPHTLRCAGDHTALQIIGRHLREQRARNKNTAVSLLDCSLRGVSMLSAGSVQELAGVALHGLVVSSGDIRRVQQGAFNSLSATLMALALRCRVIAGTRGDGTTTVGVVCRGRRGRGGSGKRGRNGDELVPTLATSTSCIHFIGIRNLTYLDISDNQLTDISEEAFKPLVKLAVLRLRGNLLKVPALVSLKQCFGSTHISGLTNLTNLNLHNNQIDVLEDYAFKHLANLTSLDLSHNEIVAVSGASLAQLTNLIHLDLSHNFLRSLSAEPLKSLRSLTELFLHDNDVSMIDDGALAQHKDLGRFTIEDNPLNCDCLMAGFARWLREAGNLSQVDKSAAVCTTPPHLEGALISRLSKSKLCDDFEHVDKVKDAYDYNKDVVKDDDYDKPDGLDDDVYDEELEVRLLDAWFDDEEVHLSWALEPPSTHRHRCTGVTVSRAGGIAKHVACHRAPPANVVLRGFKIDPADQYTFCIALEEMDSSETLLSLVLGCGSPQIVRQRVPFATAVPVLITTPPVVDALRVTEVRSNVTSDGVLTVLISVMGLPRPQSPQSRSQRLTVETKNQISQNCYVVLAVLSHGSLVAQKDTPCQSTLEITMEGFIRGPYEVCATLSKFKIDEARPICVVPQLLEPLGSQMKAGFKSLNTALVGVALALTAIIIGLVWFVRKMLKKPSEFESHRCFRQEPAQEENPRASYVMLTATSKV